MSSVPSPAPCIKNTTPPIARTCNDLGPTERISIEDPADPVNAPVDLPFFSTLSPHSFTWGGMDGISFCSKIDDVYEKIVHWKRNLFEVPNGRAGEDFVNKLSRLLEGYNDATTLECIALKAAMVTTKALPKI